MYLHFVLILLCSLTSQYDTKIASQLVFYSAISYSLPQQIQNWSCEYCHKFNFSSISLLQNKSTFGFVGYDQVTNTIIFSFRGSVDTANWITNLQTTRTTYSNCEGCSVHVGFNAAYKSIENQVRSAAEKLFKLYRNASVSVTGHSLGGALAVLAALDLQMVYGKVNQLYTYGQPRVGNAAFAVWASALLPSTYRVVNYGDQVPHIPQSILGFKHNGFQVWYYQRGMQVYKICNSQSKQCSNQLSIFTLNTADHKINLYLNLKVQNSLLKYIQNGIRHFITSQMHQIHTYNLLNKQIQKKQLQSKYQLRQ